MKRYFFTLTALVAIASASSAKADEIAAAIELGKTKYATCAACHGQDGKGMAPAPGMIMAPGYAESSIVDSPEAFALSIMKGIKKVDAKYLGVMAPLEAALTDAEIAGIMTYVRNTYKGHTDLVETADVAAWREKYAGRTEPATREELAEIAAGTAE